MPNRLIHLLFFGTLGVTTEVAFTAGSDLLAQIRSGGPVSFSLQGHSYAWMFFIYGSAAILLPIFLPAVIRWSLPIRLLIYLAGIFIIEFAAGFLLDLLIGRCPWQYDAPLAIAGYIRLDYAPFWAAFGFLLERVFLTLNRGFPVTEFPPQRVS